MPVAAAPADVVRFADRRLERAHTLRWAIAAEAVSYEARGERCAPYWMAQLRAAGVARSWDPSRPNPLQLDVQWVHAIVVAASLTRFLARLPVIPTLRDPPPRWRTTSEARAEPGVLADGLLEKVPALLTKAESTSFDAEAEAFTAKAQELVTRHRVDRALLDGAGGGSDRPHGRRIGVDDPYAEAKASLLARGAGANGCRAVWSREFCFATVFGFTGELDALEELFTSLLVQATEALRREGSKVDEDGRSRTKRFRRSFLVAFAIRIGERLRATVDETVAATSADTPRALVPVLTARADAARAAAEEVFPHTARFSPAVSDGEGWYAGPALRRGGERSLGRADVLPGA